MGQQDERFLRAQAEFEQAWERGEPFDVREFFLLHEDLGETFLLELIVLDFECRWHHQPHDAKPVEVYRSRYPEVNAHPWVLSDLICTEILYCQSPDQGKYRARFPNMETDIDELFQLLPNLPDQERQDLLASMRTYRRSQQQRSLGSMPSEESGQVTEMAKLAIGDSIPFVDQCRIMGELGEGSYKWVFHAQQSSTGQMLAVKQLKRKSAGLLDMFASEGRAQANLDHQNIPPTMLLGPDGEEPTMVAEKMIRGRPWSELLETGEYSLKRNLQILLTVSRAAEYAHRERGIVHRDIKPENVLVGRYNEIYLVDWGLAVRYGGRADHLQDDRIRHASREQPGQCAGTPAYMAPELALGSHERFLPATDVFLLGAVLYELISGRPPFLGRTRTALVRAALGRCPQFNAPEELKSIVQTAMARDPEKRFQDAGHFAVALERYLQHADAAAQCADAWNRLSGIRAQTSPEKTVPGSKSGAILDLIETADLFRQSRRVWTGDSGDGHESALEDESYRSAVDGECQSRLELVNVAIAAGDLELANAQLNDLRPIAVPSEFEQARENVDLAWRARSRKQTFFRSAISTLAILVIALGATVWFAVEQRHQRATADAEAAQAAAEQIVAEGKAALAGARIGIARAALAENDAFAQAESVFLASTIGALTGDQVAGQRVRVFAALADALVPTATATWRGVGEEDRPLFLPRTYSVLVPEVGTLITSSLGSENYLRAWHASTLQEQRLLPGLPVHSEAGSERGVNALAMHPKGNQFVSGEPTGELIFWDTKSGRALGKVQAHQPKQTPSADPRTPLGILSLAWSPDGKRVASIGYDNQLKLWDAASRELDKQWSAEDPDYEPDPPPGYAQASEESKQRYLKLRGPLVPPDTIVCFSRDGSNLISAGRDEYVRVWDISTQEVVQRLDHIKPVSSVEVSKDGKRIACGTVDGRVTVWNLKSGKPIQQLMLAPLMIPTQFGSHLPLPDGLRQQGALMYARWAPRICSLAFSPRANHLAATQGDGSVSLIRVDSGSMRRVVGHNQPKIGISNVSCYFTEDGRLITVGDDMTVRQWNRGRSAKSKVLPSSLRANGGVDLASGPNGQWAVAGNDDQLSYWKDSADESPTRWRAGEERVVSSAFIPHSDDLLVGILNGQVVRFNPSENQVSLAFSDPDEIRPPPDLATSLATAISADGKTAAASWGTDVRLWNAIDGTLLRTLPGTGKEVMAIKFRPDGKQLAVTDYHESLRLWDLTRVAAQQPEFDLIGPQQSSGLDYTEDGKRLVQAGQMSGDKTIVVWDPHSGRPVASLSGHEPSELVRDMPPAVKVFDADFSHDGQWLATCGADATVRIWRVTIDPSDSSKDKYQLTDTLSASKLTVDTPISNDWLISVAFNHDASEVATCGVSGPVHVFDMKTVLDRSAMSGEEIQRMTQRITGLKVVGDYVVPLGQTNDPAKD